MGIIGVHQYLRTLLHEDHIPKLIDFALIVVQVGVILVRGSPYGPDSSPLPLWACGLTEERTRQSHQDG